VYTKVLTIAGSDPSGGAGIQQDLRVFSQLGAYGMAAVASLTVQNTKGVKGFVPTDPQLLRDQIEFLLEDVRPHGIKTGMLGSGENIRMVARSLEGLDVPIVVDPVLVATSGDHLFEGAKSAFYQDLFPLATVITPNIHEASALAELEVVDLVGMKKAAKVLKGYGPSWVVVKGGDLDGDEVVDLLYDGVDFHHFPHPRIPLAGESHGTGCAFASTLTVLLARGMDAPRAYEEALALMELYIRGAEGVGRGAIPANPLVLGERRGAKGVVLERLRKAMEELETLDYGGLLVPEVQVNLCEAIPLARNHSEVAGIKGRIVRWGDRMRSVGCPAFGASRHVANIVLTAMGFDPFMRAAINIKFEEDWIPLLEASPLDVAFFSRKDEPIKVKEREGSTLEWGVNRVCSRLDRVPDIIYDRGDVGKEPMIRIIGRNALTVVEKAKMVLDLVL